MGKARHIVRRVVLSIITLIGVTIMTFFLTWVMPGDPAHAAAGRYATREQVEAVRVRLGLDKPLPVQYVRYMGRLLQGDLGTSMNSRASVAKELLIFFPATLELTVVAMFLATGVGVTLGTLTATGKSPRLSSVMMLFSYIGVGLPEFWAGLMLQLVFGGWLGILPLSGRLSPGSLPPPPVTRLYTIDAAIAGDWPTFWDAARHIVLPAITLGIGRVASIARITHASMLNVMRKEFIRTARAKGLPERAVVVVHALKNALIPTVTTITMNVGWLIGGAILVENIFTWGGLGTYIFTGIRQLDLPVVMAVTLFVTVGFMLLNLLADISYTFFDPRIAYE